MLFMIAFSFCTRKMILKRRIFRYLSVVICVIIALIMKYSIRYW